MATELAEGEGAFAAQVIRQVQTAAYTQVTARTGTDNRAQRQGRTGRHHERGVQRLRLTVECHGNYGTSDRHHGIGIEAQQRAAHGDFQRSSAFVIAQQKVAHTQGAAVHRTGWRHTHRPIPQTARIVLHAGLGAATQHFKGIGAIPQTFQATGPGLTAGERRVD